MENKIKMIKQMQNWCGVLSMANGNKEAEVNTIWDCINLITIGGLKVINY